LQQKFIQICGNFVVVVKLLLAWPGGLGLCRGRKFAFSLAWGLALCHGRKIAFSLVWGLALCHGRKIAFSLDWGPDALSWPWQICL
jgi:hypothetical protein